MNIVLTAIGGPSAMCFAKSLREIDGVRLIGVNAEDDMTGAALVDEWYRVPLAQDSSYHASLQAIIEREGVEYVIPFVDEEVMVLSAHPPVGCRVLVSPPETVAITGNKRIAYERLAAYLPRRFEKKDITSFPVFAKPHIGRGGKGTTIITSVEQLAKYSDDSYIFQELLRGPEVTVDALFDFDGRLKVAVPRIRTAIDQGISIRGTVFRDTQLREIIDEIAGLLTCNGPINFQFMHGPDGYTLTEINARGSGGMGITIHAGIDIPKLSYELMATGSISTVPDFVEGDYPNFAEVIERQQRKKRPEKSGDRDRV